MQHIKTIILNAALLVLAYQCSSVCASEVTTQTATTASQTVFEKTVEGLATAGPYVSVVIQAYKIEEEIRKHNYPNEEEKAHAREVAKKFTFLTTENELRKCFVDNRSKAERNRFGWPVACEGITQQFRMLGGSSEVDRITTSYNQACNLLSKGQL